VENSGTVGWLIALLTRRMLCTQSRVRTLIDDRKNKVVVDITFRPLFCRLTSHFEYTLYHPRAIWSVMGKRNVIQKTGSAELIALSSEEDRATATVNMYRKCREVWRRGF